ncbi:MAG: EAL domain-containing protein, partial [Sulfurimonadaceae bacterium]|nr:EAL domain-containing protein [Sulfurimonadaceae bacterium]
MKYTNSKLYGVIALTLVLPMLLAIYLQTLFSWRFVSLPLHSFLEATGSVIGFVLAFIIFILFREKSTYNHYHYSAFGFIAMGIFDALHALVETREVFIFFHPLSLFFGGFFFMLVWLNPKKLSQKSYFFIPIILGMLLLLLALSILFLSVDSESVSTTQNYQFSSFLHLLNIMGGTMFVVSSFYFIKIYLETHTTNILLYVGLTMLFGSSGLLFFFSSLWDLHWWLWHILRFSAYLIAFYFLVKTFCTTIKEFKLSIKKHIQQNDDLTQSVHLLAEYKKAIYEGNIVSTTDIDGEITYVNGNFEKISGYTKEELLGKNHNIIRHSEVDNEVFVELWETISHKKTWKGLLKNSKKDGLYFYAKTTIIPILDTQENIIEYLALREDVTELIDSKNALLHNFFTDRLTNLCNRHKLLEDLKNAKHPCIAILNIDNFKHINDFYGESFGDNVLRAFANKLVELASLDGYQVYRNHADEFSIVSVLAQEQDSIFLEKIKKHLRHIENISFFIEEEEIHIGITAGISLGLFDLQYADIALKEAKKFKKDYVLYSEELHSYEEYKNNIIWKKKIIEALANDRIELAFQPIFNNKTKKITKYESLVRLIDNDGKVIAPYKFLEIAKQSKLYPQITKRVLEKAFVALHESNHILSINITADDILNQGTKEFLFHQLNASNKTENIIFELVESEGIESFEEVKLFIDKVKSFGCQIAIDDF